jgi:uncharacterized protein (DUF934 family)
MEFIPLHDTQWRLVSTDDAPLHQPAAHPAPQPHALLTLEQWNAVKDHWPEGLPTGLVLNNTVDVASVAADLPRLALLVLQFPKWTDGRAYSQARLLRGRHRYQGELRATGDVLVDMAPMLQRTGFSSAQLRADQRLEAARRALRFFSGHYQGDQIEAQPHFNRQAA